MDAAIVPAILPKSREELMAKLDRLRGVVTQVQIDIVDGNFATPATWPYAAGTDTADTAAQEESGFLTTLGPFECEIDLMVREPMKVVRRWIDAGASRLTIHVESTTRIDQLLEDFHTTYGHDKEFAPELLELGLALHGGTDTAIIEPHLGQCDYVQFMGIRTIGRQGEPFDRSVLSKIQAFRRAHPDIPIQVDGGVSLDTLPQLLEAGASRFVVGSALWNAPDLLDMLRRFTETTEQYGLYS